MRVLFLHQNFPGQFLHIASAMKARRIEARAIADAANERPLLIPTTYYAFDATRRGVGMDRARQFGLRLARGEAVARVMHGLKRDGFTPDIVIGHFGWGETLFVGDVFPHAKLIVHAEYYYQAKGADIGFDPEFARSGDAASDVKDKNAAILSALVDADFGVAPTQWQGSRFPKEFQRKIAVIHEGIRTDVARPNPDAIFRNAAAGLSLTRSDEVITFVSRNLEPYRGYHIFMRALPAILAARPKARVVIVGGDAVSYGAAPADRAGWKGVFLDEVKDRLPLDRVHFVGKIPHPDFVALMQISSVHVYLTYPFVLSWSLLEAMSAGAIVVASRTAPVEEVVEDGANGLLVDFFDRQALAARVIEALANMSALAPMRRAARATVEARYDLAKCLPQWLSFVGHVVNGELDRP